ncbi:acyltransferase family protein [Novosphingobium soli]|uniref:Acyltransferase family protein n=1 Tax=Novosphingobium soli TaxID=574956 RepID=A0ABV6CWY9_9SPHN
MTVHPGARDAPPAAPVETGTPSRPRSRFEQLTAMRFFASLLVMVSHAAMMPRTDNALSWFGRNVIDYGHGRVGFFFMLSGFVLCHAYEAKFARGALTYRAFLVRRVLRIWPLHMLVAVPLAAWFLWRIGTEGLPIVVANLLLLQSWIPMYDYFASLNAPSWSLSTELFLYTMFPLLVMLSRRRLQVLCAGLVIWSFVAPAVLALAGYGHVMDENGAVGFGYWFTAINPVMRLTEFTIGMVMCRLLRDGDDRHWLPRWADGAAIVSFVAAMVVFSSLRERIPDIFFNQAFYLPAVAFLVLALAEGRGRTSRWLAGQRTLRFLGETSFALYIVHSPILRRGFDVYYRLDAPMPLVPFAILLMGLCVAVGCIVHSFIEQPMQRAIRSWLDRPARPSPA